MAGGDDARRLTTAFLASVQEFTIYAGTGFA